MKRDYNSLFEERKPFHFVQARVGHGFFKAIEAEAKKRKQSVAEFLRDCISSQILGDFLKKKDSPFGSKKREIMETLAAQFLPAYQSLQRGVEHQKLLAGATRRAQELLTHNEAAHMLITEMAQQMVEEFAKAKWWGTRKGGS